MELFFPIHGKIFVPSGNVRASDSIFRPKFGRLTDAFWLERCNFIAEVKEISCGPVLFVCLLLIKYKKWIEFRNCTAIFSIFRIAFAKKNSLTLIQDIFVLNVWRVYLPNKLSEKSTRNHVKSTRYVSRTGIVSNFRYSSRSNSKRSVFIRVGAFFIVFPLIRSRN